MIHSAIIPYVPELIQLFKKNKIEKAYLFGFAVTENFKDTSDVDIIVKIDESFDPIEAGGNLWNLIDEMEQVLNRRVDLLTERYLRNPYLIEEINRTKVAIYGN